MSPQADRTTTVVGIDGEDGGLEALALAARLSHRGSGELTLVSAYPHGTAHHTRLMWPHICSRADAERALAAAHERLPAGRPTELVAADGSTPGEVLLRVAAECGAQLVVVGSSRRAAAGRVLGGDVVGQLLEHPPCPVAVACRGLLDDARAVVRIGVCVDGSPESLEAVRWAGGLADESALRKLELIHVDATSSLAAPRDGAALDQLTDGQRAETFETLRLVARAGSPVRVYWTDAAGPIVPALADVSDRLDLLVLGTHGRGPFGRLVHGGVARDVAGRASCPVVVVPRAATPHAAAS